MSSHTWSQQSALRMHVTPNCISMDGSMDGRQTTLTAITHIVSLWDKGRTMMLVPSRSSGIAYRELLPAFGKRGLSLYKHEHGRGTYLVAGQLAPEEILPREGTHVFPFLHCCWFVTALVILVFLFMFSLAVCFGVCVYVCSFFFLVGVWGWGQ